MATGEGAEEMVEDMPNIGHKIIHEHEEMAEKLILVLYLLGAVSILGLFMNIKNKSKAVLVSYVALLLAMTAVFFGARTGTTGGEIRHTEIRTDSSTTNIQIEKEEQTHE